MKLRLMMAAAAVPLALTASAAPVKVTLAGDSTVNDGGGWGAGFRASFDSSVTVVNLAVNGMSSKSCRSTGTWTKVLATHADYVLIQFGHNDQPGKGPERETDAATTFRDNLRQFIAEVRGQGGKPVLVTPITRRNFGADGKLKQDGLADYAEAARAVAASEHVPLLDLNRLTATKCQQDGPAVCQNIDGIGPDGKPDNTHLGALGKAGIGALAAREFAAVAPEVASHLHDLVSWREAMRQRASWYASAEAIRIAENLLLYQNDNGGWEKNIDMALPVTGKDLEQVKARKRDGETTIDNDATYTQMRYLARVYTAMHDDRYRAAFARGLEYLLVAQYPNGGWPQFYPLRRGYYTHITYNDDAMIGVMETLRAIVNGDPDYAFVGAPERERARRAIEKGIECILKTQVVQNGRPTVWCAQHDEQTLAPAKARAYEHPSLSGAESVGVVRFLMEIEHPNPAVIAAVKGAVAWFRAVEIKGLRVEHKPMPGTPKGWDLAVTPDPKAEPVWARFYELGTNRPIFSGRDSVIRYNVAEIEYERRTGYRWYVTRPAELLAAYPAWTKRVGTSE